MPKIVDETVRKDEIAEAATRVFADKGFRQTSVREIAEEAGMSKGNLYHFYDSKEEILDRIFRRFEKQLHETIDRSLEGGNNPLEQLEGVTAEVFSLLQEIEPTLKVIFDFWSYSLHDTEQDVIDYDRFYGRIEEKVDYILEAGRQQDLFRSDIKEQLPSLLIGFLEGQLVQWQINPSSTPLEPADERGLQVIIDGLLKPEAR